MRQKTLPRHRAVNHNHNPANVCQDQSKDSIIFTQDVSEKFMDIEEYVEIRESQKGSRLAIVGGRENATDSNGGEKVSEKVMQPAADGASLDAESLMDDNFGAVNLSFKDGFGTEKEKRTTSGSPRSDSANSDDKFAGSLLYKMMTDPKFVENIRHDKEVKKLTCKFCKEKFNVDEELQGHLNSRVNDLNQITCCACGKIFGQKRYLRYHQRYHLEKNKFTCGFCPKKYSRMDNLARHRTFHTNPNKYSCNVCKKSFSRRDLMTKHLRSHEKKDINCDTCKEDLAGFAKTKAHELAYRTKNNSK